MIRQELYTTYVSLLKISGEIRSSRLLTELEKEEPRAKKRVERPAKAEFQNRDYYDGPELAYVFYF